MSRKRASIDERLEAGRYKVFAAEMQNEWVTAREQPIARLGDELRAARENNHFTDLFIRTVGGPK